jgi:hypothetical protein
MAEIRLRMTPRQALAAVPSQQVDLSDFYRYPQLKTQPDRDLIPPVPVSRLKTRISLVWMEMKMLVTKSWLRGGDIIDITMISCLRK